MNALGIEVKKESLMAFYMLLWPSEDIKKRWQDYTELYKKDVHDPDNHDGVITDLEPDIPECEVKWAFAGERHSTRDKGHEEGGLAYTKAGSSLGSPPGYSWASTPQKTRVCLLYCFVLSLLTLLGAVPYHHLALSDKELTYSSN